MATAVGLVIVKRFDYRGDPNEEWSNKYWLTGPVPADFTAWKVLADGLIAEEKTCYSAQTRVTRVYGYDDNATDANSVWSYDYGLAAEEIPGTLVSAAGIRFAGDQAGRSYWKTARKTERGKWVYLSKFFHDGFVNAVDTDAVSTETVAAYNAFALGLADGTFNNRMIRSQAQEEQLQNWGADQWVTTRTLKRRGKRPLTIP